MDVYGCVEDMLGSGAALEAAPQSWADLSSANTRRSITSGPV